MRELAELYESMAIDHADCEMVVFVARRSDLDLHEMRMIWGEDWESQHRDTTCTMCQEPVIIRPIFAKPTAICMQCMPAAMIELQKDKRGSDLS